MLVKKITAKISALLSEIRFLIRNVRVAFSISKIPERKVGSIRTFGLDGETYPQAKELYEKFNSSRRLGRSRRLLYHIFGSRLVVACKDQDGKLLGAAFYYFNERDVKDGTVHQSFSVVDSSARGKGVATEIRRSAILHFSNNGFKGLSSRVSIENKASLSSNYKLGFVSREIYTDPVTGLARHYLVCEFDRQVRETDE